MTGRIRRRLAWLLCAVLLLGGGALALSLSGPKRPANLLVIVIDTLGAEHVGAYTNGLTTTPNIDRLAANGALFLNAYSTAPWTKPSIASLFTGLMPAKHGLIGLNDILSEKRETMAEVLKARGARTGGIVSHTFIDVRSGMGQGFEDYSIVKFKGNVHDVITSQTVSDDAIRWLDANGKKGSGFFLFVHYFDPHYNYQHHEAFDRTSGYSGSLQPGLSVRRLRRMIPKLTEEDVRYLIGLYHEEIAFTDHHIGRLMEHLEKTGMADDTLVVLTADHGEEIMRHGYIGHTRTLYDELIKVPLIMRWPGGIRPGAVDWPVSVVDVMPTVLDLFGARSGGQLDGVSLTGCLRGSCPADPRNLFAEVDFKSSGIEAKKSAVMAGPDKLILDVQTNGFELYDREKDPHELSDLAGSPEGAGVMNQLRDPLIRYQEERNPPPPERLEKRTPKEIQELRTLGYL